MTKDEASLKVSAATHDILAQMKLNMKAKSMDAVIRYLLRTQRGKEKAKP